LTHYYYELSNMRADLVSIREGLSSPESGHLTLKHQSLSGLSEDITAAIVILECAEEKLFKLGRYAFSLPDRIARGELRPLRTPSQLDEAA
jgi:hypothetical protein